MRQVAYGPIGVGVGVGSGVGVGVGIGVGVGVGVGCGVGVGVGAGVGVGVGAGVGVGVGATVGDALGEADGEAEALGLTVGLALGLSVALRVGLGDGDGFLVGGGRVMTGMMVGRLSGRFGSTTSPGVAPTPTRRNVGKGAITVTVVGSGVGRPSSPARSEGITARASSITMMTPLRIVAESRHRIRC
jgi:hypothetical protein